MKVLKLEFYIFSLHWSDECVVCGSALYMATSLVIIIVLSIPGGHLECTTLDACLPNLLKN